MPTQADVRRIALKFPGAEAEPGWFSFGITNKGKFRRFTWVWRERVEPKKPKVPNPGVIAIRVPNLGQKAMLLAADSRKFFTESHYDGYPAVLVRLDAVTITDLKILIEDAWRCLAPTSAEPRKVRRAARPAKRKK